MEWYRHDRENTHHGPDSFESLILAPDAENLSSRPADAVNSLITPDQERAVPSPDSTSPTPTKAAPSRIRIDLGEDVSDLTGWGGFKREMGFIWQSAKRFRLFWRLTLVDARSRKGSCALSFCAVFCVVMLCTAMLSVLASLPVTFLRLGEAEVGDADLCLTTSTKMYETLNYTLIREILEDGPKNLQINAPRIQFTVEAYNPESCNTTNAHDLWYVPSSSRPPTPTSQLCTSACVPDWCNQSGIEVSLIAINAILEKTMKVSTSGSSYDAPDYGTTIISINVAEKLDAEVGGIIFLILGKNKIPRQVFAGRSAHGVSVIALEVVRIVSLDPKTFPTTDDFVVINYDDYARTVSQGLSPSLPDDVRDEIARVDPNTFATQVYFQMPEKQRRNVYVRNNYKAIRSKFVEWGNEVVFRVGWSQVSATAPILQFLGSLEYVTLFLGLIMSLVIVALVVLSVVLIYALTAVGIETRTYELGIQRMMGITRCDLVFSVLTSAYFYAVPGVISGLAAGQTLYSLLRLILQKLLELTLDPMVAGSAVGFAILSGLLIPLLAAFLPIISLVTLPLPRALDVTHSKREGMVYKIVRNSSDRHNGVMLGLGAVIAIFGILIYYLLPTSLVTLNMSLMLYIFITVLLGMLCGLVLLASNFERVVETCVAYLFFFWESRAVFRFTLKSLASHRQRNGKTTMMYSLSMAFIMLLTVAFQIQITSMMLQEYRNAGTKVVISFPTRSVPNGQYVDISMNNELDTEEAMMNNFQFPPTGALNFYLHDYALLVKGLQPLMNEGLISGVTFNCAPLTRTLKPVETMNLATIGRFSKSFAGVKVIAPNFYDVVFSDFVIVNKHSTGTRQFGLSGALYSAEGLGRLIISTTTYKKFGMQSMADRFIQTTRINGVSMDPDLGWRAFRTHGVRASAVMDSSPVFLMTKYPNSNGEVLASMPTILRLANLQYMSVEAISISQVRLRVSSNDPRDYKKVQRAVQKVLEPMGFRPRIKNIDDSFSQIESASNVFDIFFIVTQVMILVICVFCLMSSMTTNIMESSKEIAILLCLGMTNFQVYRVYVEEAVVLVVSSGVLGFLVGVFLAYTMQLQNVLFTQLPVPYPFPYIQLCIVIGMGVVSSLVSSISPVMYLLRLPSITHILRKTLS